MTIFMKVDYRTIYVAARSIEEMCIGKRKVASAAFLVVFSGIFASLLVIKFLDSILFR